MATLNTASSIVDFLKSQNKPSDFASRKSTYDNLGLTGAFGDYRGTAEQNTTLLNKVRTTTGSVDTTGADFILGKTTPGMPSYIEPPKTEKDVIDQTGPSTISTAFDLEQSDADKALEEEKKNLTMDLAAGTARGAETLGRDVATLNRTAGEEATDLATQGAQKTEQLGEQFAAAGLFRSGKREKSQAEVAQEVAQGQQRIQAKLGDQLYNTFSDFEKNFGTKFLESLSIPEAQQFVKLPVAIRGVVMNQYQEAVQKAEEKAQKGALATLEKLGYAVIGGQIVPTLERQRFEKPPTPNTPAVQDEYEYAKSQGFTGSFLDYQKLKATQYGTEKTGGSNGAVGDVDEFAQALHSGQITITNIPKELRARVLAKTKEYSKTDLLDDIAQAKNLNDYGSREDLISKLQEVYKEFTKDEIANEVYAGIPDKPSAGAKEGFIDSLTNWLF